MNVMTIMGQIAFGFASDRVNVHLPLIISSICTTIAVCTLWLLGTHLPHLVFFAVFYGFFAGGYNVLYARFATMLSNNSANTGLWVYGLLAFDRGLGYVISGPISSAILAADNAGQGNRSGFRGLILFDGVVFGLSACGGLGWFLT